MKITECLYPFLSPSLGQWAREGGWMAWEAERLCLRSCLCSWAAGRPGVRDFLTNLSFFISKWGQWSLVHTVAMQGIMWVITQALGQTHLGSNPKRFCHILIFKFWTDYFTSLRFSFLIPKIEMMIILPLSIVIRSTEILHIKFLAWNLAHRKLPINISTWKAPNKQ